jgi:hypothetical protein
MLPLADKTLKKLSPKDTVEAVFEGMGGLPRMIEWAKSNPSTYYTQLYSKLVAQPIDVNLTGGIRIELPWLISRPGRQPITIPHEPVQVPAETALHSPPQQDAKVRVPRVSSPQRKNRKSGQ